MDRDLNMYQMQYVPSRPCLNGENVKNSPAGDQNPDACVALVHSFFL